MFIYTHTVFMHVYKAFAHNIWNLLCFIFLHALYYNIISVLQLKELETEA